MDKGSPIFDKLTEHIQKKPISFHVPGHKMGKGFYSYGSELFNDILKIDMTEITGLDDLHQPEGIILEAEQKAAKLFGSKKTFFLVNGSTTGNLAMILTVCKPGEKIIVQRNVHKSVINGLILARARPIYISPEPIEQLGIAGSINITNLKELLELHSDAKAVFLMNPNYYGIGIGLTEIAELVHQYNMLLLVDEAHGAHFGFHHLLPQSALRMGADMVVQSTHKTLSAMTMGSMLHVNTNSIDFDQLKFYLTMIQSSSPSYPILASLDLTCRWIEEEGEQLWEEQIAESVLLKAVAFNNIKLNHRLEERYFQDPLKIIINNNYISGNQMKHRLEQRGIYPEFADNNNILAIISLGTTTEDFKALREALFEIDNDIINIIEGNSNDLIQADNKIFYYNNNKESKISMEKVLYSKLKRVSLNEAIGRIAAEMIIPYPPGIPLINLGEEITSEAINYAKELKKNGAKFQGISDISLNSIKVIAEEY